MKVNVAKNAQREFDAQREFEESKEYYKLQQRSLGARFEKEFKEVIARIKQYPEAWPLERDGIRRCIFHKFPYKVLYHIDDDVIIILAVANMHREPNYWIDRIEPK